ncbi:YdgA family protein [Chitinimonas sp. BJYL2]|uniref:YdgA family protein n=1 Tax=Chitinimonas sp. BJYL2 TaxID=2976696 RepID=UPI0022B37ED2|nr:YdgA family protein [Chitinimonas sp. BJYL2]
MKQKPLIIAAIAIAGLGLAYTGTSWWAGKTAEETLAKQHQLLADLPYFTVKSREYQRGVFSSTERTTVSLAPHLIKSYRMLPLKELGDLKLEMSYTQTVRHGPFPLLLQGNPTPLKAAVTTDIEFSAETQALLKKMFGDDKPLQIENRIAFNNDGTFTVKIPAFTYEETLAKVKTVWKGLDATIDYGRDFDRVDINAIAPELHFEAGPKGVFDLKDLRFTSRNVRGVAGLMLGEGKLTLASATFKRTETEAEGVPALDAKLEGLSYSLKTTAQGDFIDSGVDVVLNTLSLNGKTYGPAKLALTANHLHAPTLAKLSETMSRIQREVQEPAAQADQLIAAFKKDGLPLLRNDPALAIKQLSVKLPEGEVSLKADLALKGFEDKDLDNPIKVMEKLQANADLKLPKQVIETYVLWQARGMIAVDTEEGERPDTEELDQLARNLMESQIEKLTQQHLIRVEGENLATTGQWKNGRLTVNGRLIPLPWQVNLQAEAAAQGQ